MALVDTMAEQARLGKILEASKPALPQACRHLHYLLSTTFRYPPSRHGSRFRAPFAEHGCFYAAEQVEAAAIEVAFWRLLVQVDAPSLPLPTQPLERKAFSAHARCAAMLDLTAPPLLSRREGWTHPTDYAPCQELARQARAVGITGLRYERARDPEGRANIALMDCATFAADAPGREQSWWIFLRSHAIQAWCEAPRLRIEIPLVHFAADARVAAWIAARGP